MQNVSNEVTVVGAGPVGLVAALKLARAGIPVTVIEAEASLNDSPRAVVYHPPTVQALDELGVLDDMKAVGIVKYDYQTRTPDGEILLQMDMGSLLKDDTAYPYNLHLGQHQLGQIVLNHLLREPTATIRWNTRLVALEQDDRGVIATVETPEGVEPISTAWLLGTDGGRSGVRKALGLSFDGMTWPQRFVVTDVYTDFDSFGYAKSNVLIDPVDFSIICQITRDGLWRVGFGEDPALDEATIAQRIPERLGRLIPGEYRLDRFSPYRVHNRVAPTFRVGRVLLAGDAAHTCSPMGGLGLTGGILDAVALGDAMIAVLLAGAPGTVLDEYAQDRRDIFVSYTSPTSTENTRRMTERDPAQRELDRSRLQRVQDDPALQREMLLATCKLVGKSFAVPEFAAGKA
mgnify:CR=1 FL=1